jgi:flagellar motor switch protein FliN/FliY
MTDLAAMHSPTTPGPVVDPVALGTAVASGLVAVPGLVAEAVEPGTPSPLPDGDVAVVADLGAGVRAVLVPSRAVAQQVQVGPPPAEDLVEGCHAALAAAAAAVGRTLTGAPVGATPDAAAAATGETAAAAVLRDADGNHAATITVVAPAPAAPAEDAALHEFAPLPEPAPALVDTGLELLHDVRLGVTAELGRTQMLVREVLTLAPGSVIELDRAAGSPVDVLVNGTLIARGEVVVIDEEFGIRITEVVGYVEGAPR